MNDLTPITESMLILGVSDIRAEAKDILSVELRREDGGILPPFTAGSHLEIHMPGGLIRQYSLCNDPRERDRYVVAVGRSPTSRGGSEFVHRSLRVGHKLKVVGPRNHFPMAADAASHVFIAGGIGITPMLAMVRTAAAQNVPWRLYYLVRSRLRAAFLEDLAPFGSQVILHCDDEAGGPCDLQTIFADVPRDAAIYCCGPGPLMAAVEQAAADHDPELLRFEFFAPRAISEDRSAEGFVVRLARSGQSITVSPEHTILEALEDNGVEISWACREGICGSCELRVVAGIPDHRDSFLSKSERDSNATVICCVSRALSDELTLDL